MKPLPVNNYKNALGTILVYSEPYKTSETELLAKTANGFHEPYNIYSLIISLLVFLIFVNFAWLQLRGLTAYTNIFTHMHLYKKLLTTFMDDLSTFNSWMVNWLNRCCP